ncbi:MAG: MerR family transcriptional regulator [Terrisporobacter sp.]|uniref:MerR family transcriptional regulator n=1 Tax=Terrisporobacter sp. TaxID=1965305 RepID=UPI002FCA0C86
MDNKLLSITQLAKLRKVTSETLRYYDRIGLIKPDYVDPKNNYRYYSILQYEKLGTIKELRQLGMSIENISNYFEDRNLKKSIEAFSKYQELLKNEISQKTKLEKVINQKIDFLNQLSQLPPINIITQHIFPDRYIITFDEPTGGANELAFAVTNLEWNLNEIAPIVATDRIGVYCNESILNESKEYIPSCPFIFIKKNDNVESYLKKVVPGGMYLTMYYQGEELEKYDKSFELIKSYMNEHNLCLNGCIYQIFKVDVTLTSNPKETILEIQVPVKSINP